MNNQQDRARDAINGIREMFKDSGLTEKELQDSGKEIRREIMKQYSSNSEQNTPSSTLLSRRTSGTVSRQGRRNAYNDSVSRIKIFERIQN